MSPRCFCLHLSTHAPFVTICRRAAFVTISPRVPFVAIYTAPFVTICTRAHFVTICRHAALSPWHAPRLSLFVAALLLSTIVTVLRLAPFVAALLLSPFVAARYLCHHFVPALLLSSFFNESIANRFERIVEHELNRYLSKNMFDLPCLFSESQISARERASTGPSLYVSANKR